MRAWAFALLVVLPAVALGEARLPATESGGYAASPATSVSVWQQSVVQPGPPSALDLGIGDTLFTAVWTNSPAPQAAYYQGQYDCTSASETWKTVGKPWIQTGLTNGDECTVEVRGVNGFGVASTAISDTVTPADVTAPSVPGSFSCVDLVSDGDITCTWADSTGDVLVYEFAYCLDSTGCDIEEEWTIDTDASSPETRAGLTNDLLYQARVRACDEVPNCSAYATDTATPTAAGSGGAGEYLVYDDYASNIHSCAHPLAADPSANGVLFCDGFEDGKWIAPSASTAACNDGIDLVANDGWDADSVYYVFSVLGQSNTYFCDKYGVNGTFEWAHYRPSDTVIDTTVANFGGGGTRGVASSGWLGSRTVSASKGLAASHNVVIVGGDPYTVDSGNGPGHYYFAGYFKQAGVTSMMCDCNAAGSWDCDRTDSVPSTACPVVTDDGPNGIKMIEQVASAAVDSGISGWVINRFFPGVPLSIGLCDGCNSTGTHPDYPSLIGDTEFPQNQDVNLTSDAAGDADDFFWFVFEVDIGTDTTDGVVRLWHDNCGPSGMDCPATPTLRSEWTGIDFRNTGAAGLTFDAFWQNFWFSNGKLENQYDELIVVDADVSRGSDNPISPITHITGLTVTP